MRPADLLLYVLLFPLAGFLVNGAVYLWAHSKRGDKNAPYGPHGPGGDAHAEPHGAHEPHPAEAGGHGLTHDPAHPTADAHARGHSPEEHAHHDIPFKGLHTWVGPLASGLSCVTAFVAVAWWWATTHGHEAAVAKLFTWLPLGANPTHFGLKEITVDAALRLDPLSALMLLFVTFIGTLIHVYSVGYMGHDEGYGRFFAYLNLFMFSMLTLVLGANLPVLFVGWEGVGLCSYLLIGYYYTKDFAADAGKKAFVMNRIGDFGFVLGIGGCFALFGTADFGTMFTAAAADPGRWGFWMTAVCVALFIGACGKSAQIPLYVWLPDAMAGPTPVSALIHAATMVTAGVYMVARCNVFFRISHEWAVRTLGEGAGFFQLLTHDASLLVAVVGCATAFFAATMGLAQTDIKKVLAYSTVSQLGYMFLGCGALAFGAGMFHVFTHAWFKACLFLGSGSVIHALAGEQEMTKMGGLKNLIPQTYRTMLISTIAIAGVPLFSGFFSKDQILGETWARGYKVLWVFAALTAGMTAFYMFRLIRMTFFGEFRGTAEQLHHVHESPRTMTIPLWILAAGAVVAGYWGVPKFIIEKLAHGYESGFEAFLGPIFIPLAHGWQPHPHHAEFWSEFWLMLGSVAIAGVGILLGVRFYSGAYPFAIPSRIANAIPALYRLVRDKYRIDELYEAVFVNGLIKRFGGFLWEVDARVVDGAVNGSRHATVGASVFSSWIDSKFVDGAVNGVAEIFQAAWRGMRRVQTGQAQTYAMTMAFGIFGLVCIYLILAP